VPASTQLFADDIIALLDHLNMKSVYFVGLVGIGACIGQWVAFKRPDLVRCMVNMGCWTWADSMLSDQLTAFGDMHEHAGFHAFQSMVASLSFRPEYYNANRAKLLGSGGVWGALEGRIPTHLRFIEACLGHDIRPHLSEIVAPTLVIHAGEDMITGPRTTMPLEEGLPNSVGVSMDRVAHVVAGKEEKIIFGEILFDFLNAH
jgi:pimeloyl-ACP methyl ester carboxylesterase